MLPKRARRGIVALDAIEAPAVNHDGPIRRSLQAPGHFRGHAWTSAFGRWPSCGFMPAGEMMRAKRARLFGPAWLLLVYPHVGGAWQTNVGEVPPVLVASATALAV